MSPGYVTNDEVDFMALLDAIDSTQLCPDCRTIRTSRSRHCSVCGHCIERFDHHCPWLNNCIGVKNHNYFYLYILTQLSVIAFAFGQGVVSIISFINDYDISETGTPFVPKAAWLESAGLFYPMVSILILVTGFFLVPVGLLVFVQSTNFLAGRTTMERFSRSAGDVDQNTKIMNSGIKDDIQVYKMLSHVSLGGS